MRFFLFLLLLTSGCKSSKNIINMDENVKIEIRFIDCVQINEFNEVKFLVTNDSNEPIIIHAWHLYLTKVYDNNGRVIKPDILIEYTATENLEEYIEVEAYGNKEISFHTEFFKSFNLRRGITYKVEGVYNGMYSTKGKKFKFNIDETRIEVCD